MQHYTKAGAGSGVSTTVSPLGHALLASRRSRSSASDAAEPAPLVRPVPPGGEVEDAADELPGIHVVELADQLLERVRRDFGHLLDPILVAQKMLRA